MKFCQFCGNQLEDDSKFCLQCGALQPESVYDQPAPQKPKKDRSSLIILLMIIVIIMCATVICLCIFVLPKSGKKDSDKEKTDSVGYSDSEKDSDTTTPEAFVKSYLKAINDRNSTKIVDMLYPEPMLKYMENEFSFTKSTFVKTLDNLFKVADDKYGDDWEVTAINISKAEDLTGDDLESLKHSCEKFGIEFSNGQKMTVAYKIEGKKDRTEMSDIITVFKYQGDWYIANDGTNFVVS